MILGKGKKGALGKLVDPERRFLRIDLVEKRRKEAVKDKTIHLLTSIPVHIFTCDNGKDFSAHEEIAEALNAASALLTHVLYENKERIRNQLS